MKNMKKRMVFLFLIVCLVASNVSSFAYTTYWLDEHYWTSSSTVYDAWHILETKQSLALNYKNQLNDLKSQLYAVEHDPDFKWMIGSDISQIALPLYIGFISFDPLMLAPVTENCICLIADINEFYANQTAQEKVILDKMKFIASKLMTVMNQINTLHNQVFDSPYTHYAP